MSESNQRTRSRIAEARRTALDAQSKQREAARAREQRVVGLATTVIAALRERDQVVQRTEREAGEALRELADGEGLSGREVLDACGGELDEREAARLRRATVAEERHAAAAEQTGVNAAPAI